MSFINKQLMDAVEASGSTGIASMAADPAARAMAALAALTAANLAVTTKGGANNSALTAKLPEWAEKYVDFETFILSKATTFASDVGLANEYRTLKNIVDGQAGTGGCAEVLGVTGFHSGQHNGDLNTVAGYMEDLTEELGKYVADAISAGECETAIAFYIPLIDNGTTIVMNKMDNEINLLKLCTDYLKQVGVVQQLMSLWNNPCTQALMQETLPQNFKDALSNPAAPILNKVQGKAGLPADFGNFSKKFGGG